MAKKSKAATHGGQRQSHQEAVEGLAADIAQKAEPAIALALTGGRSTTVSSEQSAYIAAAIARDQDKGGTRPLSEYVNEARRR